MKPAANLCQQVFTNCLAVMTLFTKTKNPSKMEGSIFKTEELLCYLGISYSSILRYSVVSPMFNNRAVSVLLPLACCSTF